MYRRCNCEDFPCCGCELGYEMPVIDVEYQFDDEYYDEYFEDDNDDY